MDWIKCEDRLPESGVRVIAWYEGTSYGYDLSEVDENGQWKGVLSGNGLSPAFWMAFPALPAAVMEEAIQGSLKGEIIGGRLIYDIEEDKEAVAELMQHYINGREACINDGSYYVVDMKNEMVGDKLVTSFYLKAAS